jgi:ATP-dependent HslUV protease ATP-binding subunit HslU
VKILTLPENALIKQYAALVATEGVEVEFTDDGIREIAALAGKANEQVENIGARRLHTIMTTLLEDVLFDAPDTLTARKILVNREMVQSRLAGIVQDTDLSKYIL